MHKNAIPQFVILLFSRSLSHLEVKNYVNLSKTKSNDVLRMFVQQRCDYNITKRYSSELSLNTYFHL